MATIRRRQRARAVVETDPLVQFIDARGDLRAIEDDDERLELMLAHLVPVASETLRDLWQATHGREFRRADVTWTTMTKTKTTQGGPRR